MIQYVWKRPQHAPHEVDQGAWIKAVDVDDGAARCKGACQAWVVVQAQVVLIPDLERGVRWG